jgi:hypothetical protein
MPSRYKILIPLVVLIAAGALAFSVSHRSLHAPPQAAPDLAQGTTTVLVPPAATSSNPTPKHTPVVPTVESAQKESTTTKLATTVASLVVQGTHYPLTAPAGTTLQSAMDRLAAEDSSFVFTTEEYPSLGKFVTSINGKTSADGNYWFLYINGKESETGISTTIIHQGDTIEWKYEK